MRRNYADVWEIMLSWCAQDEMQKKSFHVWNQRNSLDDDDLFLMPIVVFRVCKNIDMLMSRAHPRAGEIEFTAKLLSVDEWYLLGRLHVNYRVTKKDEI